MASTDPKRELLRHTLATVVYRGSKTLRDAPAEFASYRTGEGSRTPAQILAHVGDLFDWALSIAQDKQRWHNSMPLEWGREIERFFASVGAFDAYLASDEPLGSSVEELFQGPIADALTHFGQIAMLRRMSGAPMRGENYFVASIAAGQVGPEQPPPRREF